MVGMNLENVAAEAEEEETPPVSEGLWRGSIDQEWSEFSYTAGRLRPQELCDLRFSLT